ncbi:hypothetical protein QN277_015809 [Acacia crassicarpa]|uniref:RING-CH-type domain-containing protein n=1 Tax=Acacia crassicarpa TaxID=499986 RepID=A0AAE1MVL1_9FABA|nr:hypothetical protein QN277_015809 [Acacia crassicarpa]
MVVTEEFHAVDIDNGGRRSSSVGDGGDGRHQDAADSVDKEQKCSDEVSNAEIVGVPEKEKGSPASECTVEVDLGNVVTETKVHLGETKRDCRICHLSMDMTNHESGSIELGCSCKDDLVAAHKQCAEAWFKIKGNKTCEICGSIARNVTGAFEVENVEQWNESNDATLAAPTGPVSHGEHRSFWRGHRFLNFLLACMVFAFVISWLFHFNVPS